MALSFTKTEHHKPYPFISPTRPELSAKGKNIVITGGGTGIGKAIGVAFAQAGAKSVSIIGRRIEKLKDGAEAISAAAAKETKVLSKTSDISKLEELSATLKSIVDEVGKIDVFISHAGSGQPLGPVLGLDVKDLKEILDTNVIGTFNSINAFMQYAGPVLLNTTTGFAHMSPIPQAVAYSATKATGTKIMEYFAAENPGVHVVNVSPGFVPTDFNSFHPAAQDSPDLAGNFYVWLTSPEAKFLKSKLVWVNWDAEELLQRAGEISSNKKLLTTGLEGYPI